jgi:hypothetical protein
MDWVSDGIAIGSRRDAMERELLQSAGINAILQLYGPERERPDFPHVAVAVCLYVVDGEPLNSESICTGVEFIRTQRRAGNNVLVACGAGMSRSAAFVAAFLVEEGEDLADAFLTLMRQRPIIMPHPVVLRSLVEYYNVAASTETILARLARERRLLLYPQARGQL